MRCAWDELIRILPLWMRKEVDEYGKKTLQELRLRQDAFPCMVCGDGTYFLERFVTTDDIHFVINAASQYSPWRATSIADGYITTSGGHRIGICGEAIMQDGEMTGIRYATSLCVRVGRDLSGISDKFKFDNTSVLIIGPPGTGKTTLLRDLIRRYSSLTMGSIAVLDERGEIFPSISGKMCFPCGRNTDILSNCSKVAGIHMLLRTMGPACIALDEITSEEDCNALIDAFGCGVRFIATAHAGSVADLKKRRSYYTLLKMNIFNRIIIMHRDKSWTEERI